MAAELPTDLESFRRFIDEQLVNGGDRLSPEEALRLWRGTHPTREDHARNIEAVQEAIADMEAGDRGRPFDEFIEEFRKKHGIPHDA